MSWFSKILKIIAMVLAVIFIVYLILAALVALSAGGIVATAITESFFALGVGWGSGSFLVTALLAGVLSAAISPEGFHAVVDPVVDGASVVASTIAAGSIKILGAAASGASALLWPIIAVGAYLYFSGGKSDDPKNTNDKVSSVTS